MRSGLRAIVLSSSVVIALAGGHGASGAGATWNFTCSGPVGTPSSFTAIHERSNGTAFRLTDGTSVFVGMVFEDLTAGKRFEPPGATTSGIITTTCSTINPFNEHALRIAGRFAP